METSSGTSPARTSEPSEECRSLDEATLKRIMQEHEAFRKRGCPMEQENVEAEGEQAQERINSEQLNTYQSLLRKQFKPSDFHGRVRTTSRCISWRPRGSRSWRRCTRVTGYPLRAGTASRRSR